jgi:hypothetical protein
LPDILLYAVIPLTGVFVGIKEESKEFLEDFVLKTLIIVPTATLSGPVS